MATIWIDLDNAPHVPLFKPLIHELQSRGHSTLVTVRDYGYTRELIDQHNIPYTLIGQHSGKNPILKVTGLASRVFSLARWVRRRNVNVAVSHGSRAMVLASALLRIPCITMYDYEFVSTSIFNRFSHRVLLPSALTDDRLKSLGLDLSRVSKYPGLKEEVYLGDFTPDRRILDELEIDERDVLIVLRPPATSAHYHNPMSERIVERFLDRISASKGVTAVIVPRTAGQAAEMGKLLTTPEKFRILTRPVDGLNLIAHADLVVGGGGTMNREAALLQVPVFSVFMGKIGAIDETLRNQGQLKLIRNIDEVDHVPFQKRECGDTTAQRERRKERSRELVEYLCDQIVGIANSSESNEQGFAWQRLHTSRASSTPKDPDSGNV